MKEVRTINIFKYFKERGIETINPSFYSQIKVWESWYKGDVAKFHYYRVYNGTSRVRCRRLSLGMAKKVSEDIADLLLNEKVKITIGKSDATSKFVEKALKDNQFNVKGNEYQERKAYTGTVAYVPHIKTMDVSDDGRLIKGEGIRINYVSAKNIFPISWENGVVKEAAFVFEKTHKNKKYALIQFHLLKTSESGKQEYSIEHDVIECTNGSGTKVQPDKWDDIAPFEGLQPVINTGTDKPQFVIDRLNIVNNASDDDTNPMGVAVFANAIDVLAKIDLEYDSYANEFSLGKKRIFISPDMLQTVDGEPVFDENDTTFYQLPEDTLKGDKPIMESNMELRVEDHSKAINDDLNWLSFKCGFGTERYKFENGNITTATQVISENSDMYRTIKKHELILDDVLKQLVMIIVRLGIASGVPGLSENIDINIDFDDSIIEDKTAERQSDRQDVAMGAMGIDEYRAKHYGETLEEARKNLPIQNTVME